MGLWRDPDYRWWLAGDTAGTLGMSIRSFALPLVSYGLTGSPFQAGLVLTAATAISVAATPLGGVLVDRYDRRTMIRAHVLVGASAWGAVLALLASGRLTFPLLVGLACLGALGAGLFGYATDAALRSIVATTEYPGAMATNQGRDAAVELVAGPLGGLLYALREWAPFAATLGGYLVAGLATVGIRTDLRPPARQRRGVWAEFREAFDWLAARPRVRAMTPPILIVNFGVNGVLLGVPLALIERGHTPVEIGWFSAAVAVASLLGSVLAGWLVARVGTGRLAASALGWFAVCLAPVLMVDSYPVLVVLVSLSMLLMPAVNASLLGYLFAMIPVELQGRAQSVLTLAAGAMTALSPVTAGAALAGYGFGVMAAVFLAAVVLAAGLIVASQRVRGIPKPEEWQDSPL